MPRGRICGRTRTPDALEAETAVGSTQEDLPSDNAAAELAGHRAKSTFHLGKQRAIQGRGVSSWDATSSSHERVISSSARPHESQCGVR